MNPSSLTVLCVDDDADDLFFITSALQQAHGDVQTGVAYNGVEALEYLEQAKQRGDLPALIVLDINMPLMDGKETLAKLKKDPQLQSIPVVVYTTSASPLDQLYCAHYGVEMITKPDTPAEVDRIARNLLGVIQSQ